MGEREVRIPFGPPLEVTDMDPAEAELYVTEWEPLTKAVQAFLLLNFGDRLLRPTFSDLSAADRLGGLTGKRREWADPSGSTNAEVVEYRDPTMNHENYNQRANNAYITIFTIWDWLSSHPRIP